MPKVLTELKNLASASTPPSSPITTPPSSPLPTPPSDSNSNDDNTSSSPLSTPPTSDDESSKQSTTETSEASSDSDSSESSNSSGDDEPESEEKTQSEEEKEETPLTTPTPPPPAEPTVEEIFEGYNANPATAINTIADELKKEKIENKDNFEEAVSQFLAANASTGFIPPQDLFKNKMNTFREDLTTHKQFATMNSNDFQEALNVFLNLQKLTKLRQYYPALKQKVTVTTGIGTSKVTTEIPKLSQWIKQLKEALSQQAYSSRNNTITRALGVTVTPTPESTEKKKKKAAAKKIQKAFRARQTRKKSEKLKAKKAATEAATEAKTAREEATQLQEEATQLQTVAKTSQQAADAAAATIAPLQEDLEARKTALDQAKAKFTEKETALAKAQTALNEAKDKVTAAENDLANPPTGAPVSPPVIVGGTPLKQLEQSLTTLKSKLAHLGQALHSLQTGVPMPAKAATAVDNKKALQDAVTAAKAAQTLAQAAVDTATQERDDAQTAQQTAQAAFGAAQAALNSATTASAAAAQKATEDKTAADTAQAEATKLKQAAEEAKAAHKKLKKPKKTVTGTSGDGAGASVPPTPSTPPTTHKKKKKKHQLAKTPSLTKLPKPTTPGKSLEEGEESTSPAFDFKAKATKTKQEIARRLSKAQKLLAQAKNFSDVQDNDQVKTSIAAAEKAIQTAESTKTNRLALAGEARRKATEAKNTAEHAQAAHEKQPGAATTIQKTFRGFLTRKQLAAKKAASEKLASAQATLEQAKLIEGLESNPNVPGTIEAAKLAIETATDATSADAQSFLEEATKAEEAAKHALEFAKATKKEADEEAAEKAALAAQGQTKLEIPTSDLEKLVGPTKGRARIKSTTRRPPSRRAQKPGQQATKTSEQEKQAITNEAQSVVTQINAISDGANTTLEIQELLTQAKQKLAALQADDDVTGKQALLNEIKPILAHAKIAADNEHARKEQAAKIAEKNKAAAEELPKIVTAAQTHLEAMKTMKRTFPKPLTKFSPAGKIVLPAIDTAQSLYEKLELTQNNPKDSAALKGPVAQKRALTDLKKEYDKVVSEFTKAGGTPPDLS